jgi:hypothetical protein
VQLKGADAVQDASTHPSVNLDGETGPVSRTVTRDRSFFYGPARRFVRDGGRFGPIQRHKAYSRAEAETAPRAPSVGGGMAPEEGQDPCGVGRLAAANVVLWTAVVCDGPGLIVSSAHRKARARLSIARFQTIQEGLVQAK